VRSFLARVATMSPPGLAKGRPSVRSMTRSLPEAAARRTRVKFRARARAKSGGLCARRGLGVIRSARAESPSAGDFLGGGTLVRPPDRRVAWRRRPQPGKGFYENGPPKGACF
jgi:hypothetical protein